jgi:thioredoxin 1
LRYLEKILIDMADKVLLIRINADDNQSLCKELRIDALPILQHYKNPILQD